jgi:hypothetical protein
VVGFRAFPQLLVITCIVATFARASVVPSLDLSALTNDSDVIVVGMVDFHSNGSSGSDQQKPPNGPRFLTGALHVEQVLKGSVEANTIEIRLVRPDESNGYSSIPAHRHRMIFLRHRVGETYEATSPYYPSAVAVSGHQSREIEPLDRVAQQLGAVITSQSSGPEERIEAINDLGTVQSPAILSILRRTLGDRGASTRLSAVAILLEHDDISGLQMAEEVLSSPGSDTPQYLRHNLLYGISEGIRNPDSIPVLSRLLHLSEAETRRAAASALRHTGSREAISPLLSALEDTDFDVRYYAAIGLAEITGELDWRPLMEEFKAHEGLYLTHWRNWQKGS